MSAMFTRNEKLCGEVVQVTRIKNIIVTLGLGRSLILHPDEIREVELPESAPMVAHRGTATTFGGVSIE